MPRIIRRTMKLIVLLILSILLIAIVPFNSIDVIAAETNVRSVSEADIPVHTHIWKTKFNNDEHWKECTVCGEITNKHAHTLSGNGGKKTLCENGFYNQAYRETCSCGYQSNPWVVIHGRYENYTSSQKLNYGNMTSQTFNTVQHVSYEVFQDLLNGTNELEKKLALCEAKLKNNACIEKKDEQLLININQATKEELMTLTGIGEAKALAIIKYREKKSFSSISVFSVTLVYVISTFCTSSFL